MFWRSVQQPARRVGRLFGVTLRQLWHLGAAAELHKTKTWPQPPHPFDGSPAWLDGVFRWPCCRHAGLHASAAHTYLELVVVHAMIQFWIAAATASPVDADVSALPSNHSWVLDA